MYSRFRRCSVALLAPLGASSIESARAQGNNPYERYAAQIDTNAAPEMSRTIILDRLLGRAFVMSPVCSDVPRCLAAEYRITPVPYYVNGQLHGFEAPKHRDIIDGGTIAPRTR